MLRPGRWVGDSATNVIGARRVLHSTVGSWSYLATDLEHDGARRGTLWFSPVSGWTERTHEHMLTLAIPLWDIVHRLP
jgi:hypothetical protein